MVTTTVQKTGLEIVCTIILGLLCVITQSQELESNSETINNERGAKFFSFVRITNRVCGNEDNRGSCYSSKDCMARGGVALSGMSCANGFGVCCAVSVSCATGTRRLTTSENVVTLASATGVASCIFTVAKSSPDVCQLQVDLTEFNLGMGPDIRGNCQQPDMTISDSVTVANNFKLCGQHSGRRLFLSYEKGPGSVIDFDFRSGNTPITHKVRITQIKCIDRVVPDQCLEYYDDTQPTRIVTSFGYPNYMINNPIYNICVDSQPNENSIEWEPCISDPAAVSDQTFRLSPWFAANTTGGVQAPVSGHDNCAGTTFVEILGGNRHCGARLKIVPTGPPLMSMVKPFTLAVHVVPFSWASLHPHYIIPYPITPMAIPPTCAELGIASGALVKAFDICVPVMGGVPAAQLYCNCPRSLQPTPPFAEPLLAPSPPRTGFCLTYKV